MPLKGFVIHDMALDVIPFAHSVVTKVISDFFFINSRFFSFFHFKEFAFDQDTLELLENSISF